MLACRSSLKTRPWDLSLDLRHAADAVALLLAHLAARESEGRALASEVLHLYREVHLIEQLSEQLAALIDLSR